MISTAMVKHHNKKATAPEIRTGTKNRSLGNTAYWFIPHCLLIQHWYKLQNALSRVASPTMG